MTSNTPTADQAIGKEIAYNNARDKIWMLEGYLLKQNLYKESIHD